MRTSAAECAEIGRRIGQRLSAATGPTTLVLPLRGVSTIDAEAQPFHDPEADRALFDALRGSVGGDVAVVRSAPTSTTASSPRPLATLMIESLGGAAG